MIARSQQILGAGDFVESGPHDGRHGEPRGASLQQSHALDVIQIISNSEFPAGPTASFSSVEFYGMRHNWKHAPNEREQKRDDDENEDGDDAHHDEIPPIQRVVHLLEGHNACLCENLYTSCIDIMPLLSAHRRKSSISRSISRVRPRLRTPRASASAPTPAST